MTENKVWTKEEIRGQLEKSQAWVEKAIVSLYAYQTAAEQASGDTQELNGVGFNGVDGSTLSYYADYITGQRGRGRKFGQCLSGKFAVDAKARILKYAGQLTKIANGEM